MQLILNTETDIGIQRKMSIIKQESFEEKFMTKNLTEKINNEIPNINEDKVKKIIEEFDDNGDIKINLNTNDECHISKENLNEINKNQTEISQSKSFIDGNQQNIDADSVQESEKKENITNVQVKEENISLKSVEDELKYTNINGEKQNVESIINTATKEDTSETSDMNLQERNEDYLVKTEPKTETESGSEKEIKSDGKKEEIINILDEKDEECITVNDEQMCDIEMKLETLLNEDNISSNLSKDNKTDVDKKHMCIEKDNDQDIKIPSSSENCLSNDRKEILPEEVLKETNENDKGDVTAATEKQLCKDTKKPPIICKLSNTLDILSDEEEESIKNESQKEISSPSGKQCINIEDDDDIMLIDEETNIKDKNNTERLVETKNDENECNATLPTKTEKESIEEKVTSDENKDDENNMETDSNKPKKEENFVENQPQRQKPLLPVNFLKTCKKNLADMTRDELEEFCILKIVESVVDRSNLNEIKSQLKTMAQNIEEYKKKALMLTKQNRDLQVVLKSVQEEQKKRSDLPITPLKITRSVGMQVFMTEKINVRRKSSLTPNNLANNIITNNTPNRINKSQTNQSPKSQKTQGNANNTQQIPVPRLVPAVNNAVKQQPATSNTAKSPVTGSLPNGVKNSPPIQKAEKRPHSRMQQGNSVTVDLTDDEPPSKIIQRNVNPPVRLVPPQSLLAPQRQPFGTSINSPRKVYIPISGSQNQVRPGQTIMLKPINPQGPRQRVPTILPKPSQNTNSVRMTRIPNRHPAPLPDSLKQYQPPNWKALPPAPELKLSKVENGIVISWKIDGYQEDNHEEIASYQLYAYQETSSPPSTALWKKIGDVKALPLPMACTLTQFMAGYKYYFAVRAVDIRSRLGPFSAPGSILLLNKM